MSNVCLHGLHGLHAAQYGELAGTGSWGTHSGVSTVQTSGVCLAKIIMSLYETLTH